VSFCGQSPPPHLGLPTTIPAWLFTEPKYS
jgi:hypothetical protein